MKIRFNISTFWYTHAVGRVRVSQWLYTLSVLVFSGLICPPALHAQQEAEPVEQQGSDANSNSAPAQATPENVAPVALSNEPGIARFSAQTNSDSTDIKNRHYTVMQYLDGQCTKPRKDARMYRKKFAKESHSFAVKEIPSGSEFFFQVDYLEARRQGDRACSVLTGFVPVANHTYRAVYETSGQVSRCSVKIFDITNGQTEVTSLSKPEFTCFRGRATNNKNSVPIHTVKPLF